MKKGMMIPLVLGVTMGGLAIKLGVDTVQNAKASARVQMITAVIAVDDIPATAEIEETMLRTIQTPKTPLMGSDAFSSSEKVLNRVAQTMIPRGAILRESLLAPKGTPPGLTVRIPKGFRAVSIKINEVSGVGYQLRPGSFVDVIAVMRSGLRKETVSRIILQRIEVVAVGRMLAGATESGGKARASKSVTLLVKNSDVPKLHLAQTNGKVTLAMRSPDDFLEADAGEASDRELLGEKVPTPKKTPSYVSAPATRAPRAASPDYTVMIVDGAGQTSTSSFASTDSTLRAKSPATRPSRRATRRAQRRAGNDPDENNVPPPPHGEGG